MKNNEKIVRNEWKRWSSLFSINSKAFRLFHNYKKKKNRIVENITKTRHSIENKEKMFAKEKDPSRGGSNRGNYPG